MASIILSGVLLDPASEFSVGDQIRFTHRSTTGETIAGAISNITIPPDGSYNIELQYGLILVEYKDVRDCYYRSRGVVTVNQDSTATTLPELLNAVVPPTDEQLLEFQAILADAVQARDEAEQFAADAEQSAQDAAASAAVFDPQNNPANFLWDVNIPFNEGVEIERGYGNRDAFGNRSVDFSRASGTGNTNKSGVVETLSIDEPAITSDGISIYESVTNELLWSEDFSQSSWGKEGGISISTDGELAPDATSLAQRAEVTTTNSFQSVRVISSPFLDGDQVFYSIFAKTGTLSTFRISVNSSGPSSNSSAEFDLSLGTVENLNDTCDSVGISELNDGWFLCWVVATKNADGNQIKILDLTSTPNVIGDYIYIFGAMAGLAGSYRPYIKTEAVAVTRASDIATMPMLNNMPAAGLDLTIEANSSLPITTNEARLWSVGIDNINIRRTGSGNIQLIVKGSANQNVISIQYPQSNEQAARYIVRRLDGVWSIFEDGALKVSGIETDLPSYDLASNIFIGSRLGSSSYLNSEIKNLRIIHRALSDDEIKALGGPQ